ncbi:MAG: RNA-binding protein [Candidatus Competibacteraceae bacterium]|nr:RNA-binding protein [Candidatus Competibacteraceae bacterium]
MVAGDNENRIRLDKWLWAARFFKTRALAVEAVAGGRVHAGGQRVKPAHAVRVGEVLSIQRGPDRYVVTVKALSDRRGPAKEAALLYEESVESRQRREVLGEQRRLLRFGAPSPTGRPTKQDRRRIVRFTQRSE